MQDKMDWNVWTALGAVGAAMLASSCCIGPVVLAALGAGSVGFATALAPYRPYFLGLTFALLGGAFYVTYRKPRVAACCAEEATCAVNSARRNKVVLWVVTTLAVSAAAFPQIQSWRHRQAEAANAATYTAATASTHRLVFKIKGMTCADCATHIQKKLTQVPGVAKATVSPDESGQAVVEWSGTKPRDEALARAVKEAGYKAVLPSKGK